MEKKILRFGASVLTFVFGMEVGWQLPLTLYILSVAVWVLFYPKEIIKILKE